MHATRWRTLGYDLLVDLLFLFWHHSFLGRLSNLFHLVVSLLRVRLNCRGLIGVCLDLSVVLIRLEKVWSQVGMFVFEIIFLRNGEVEFV